MTVSPEVDSMVSTILQGIEASAGTVSQPETGVAPAEAKQTIVYIAATEMIECIVLIGKDIATTCSLMK